MGAVPALIKQFENENRRFQKFCKKNKGQTLNVTKQWDRTRDCEIFELIEMIEVSQAENKIALNPADFTRFMTSHHDHIKEEIQIVNFLRPTSMRKEI